MTLEKGIIEKLQTLYPAYNDALLGSKITLLCIIKLYF